MVSLIIKLVQWRINGLSKQKFIFVAKSTMRREAVTQQVKKPGSWRYFVPDCQGHSLS